MIPIYQPYLPKEALRYAHDALDSTWISSQGPYIAKATEQMREKVQCKHVILINNGTCATHMLALALQFKYPRINKIIVPANVYVAAWNSFLFTGHFDFEVLDADLNTWNIDHSKISDYDFKTALLVVHNLGNIINVPDLKKKHPDLVMVEDACEGLFGKYNNNFAGTQSLLSSISFFGNKSITTGEGGAVFTNDTDLFEYLNSIKSQGQSTTRYLHDKLGYNYRMTNIQAALLCGQLEMATRIREMKHELFELYRKEFSVVDEISFQKIEQGTEHAEWMFAIRLNNFDLTQKEKIEKYLHDNGIESRPMFYPIYRHSHLSSFNTPAPNAVTLNEQCVMLPSYPELKKEEVMYICNKIKSFLRS